jgi:outer membrane lipoprotein-sorting protein
MTSTLAILTLAGLGLQPSTPPVNPKPAAEPLPTVAPEVLPSVDSVLTRLETADKDLTSLTAAVRLIKRPPAIEGGGMHVRYGILKFTSGKDAKGGGKPLRRFAIDIDTIIIDGRARDDKQSYTFDGHYLLEKLPKQKQFVRRHIVGDDQKKDPLRIGEGPFPIPVGQRKDDLLARFNVTIVPALESAPDSANLRKILFTCTQVKLIPKEGTEQAKAFTEIRLWYRSSDMLPLFALTQNADGSSNEVFLDDIIKNPPVPDSTFDTTAPNKADGWTGEEQDLRDKAEMGPGDPMALPPGGTLPAAPLNPVNPAKPNPSEPAPAKPK